MGKYIIKGGYPLNGEVYISGAKNSVLPILAATVLNKGITILKNVPILTDTLVSIDILKHLGCEVTIGTNTIVINASNIVETSIPTDLIKKMRSSIIFLGSLLGRLNKAKISYPGGCNLGKRPIDFHLNSLKKLNINISEEENIIEANTTCIKGTEIELKFPSVGATQNIMLASVCSEGITTIKNAAKEPELLDLQNFLNKMGASVKGSGTNTITITGVKNLNTTVEYTIMPDRIEAGTFLCAAAITGGNIKIIDIIPSHLKSLTDILKEIGCTIKEEASSLTLITPKTLNSIKELETAPYPLFPTDLQPQIMSVLTLAKGTSIIKEKVFDARNKHIPELNKMGADIKGTNSQFVIKGVENLFSASVLAKDLRGGASLILAGLKAKGDTVVNNSKYVKRGYEEIEKKLSILGANIKYISN